MKKFLAIFIIICITATPVFARCINHYDQCKKINCCKRYGTKTTCYDKNGNVISIAKRNMNGSITYYNPNGQVISQTQGYKIKRRPYKRSSKIVNTYNRYGEITGSYKRYGNKTTQYDKYGNKIGSYKINMDGTVTRYDKNGNKINY